MLKRPLLVGGLTAAALCPAILVAPGIAQSQQPQTKTTIGHLGDGVFTGLVKSTSRSCRRDRRVILYRLRRALPARRVGSYTLGSDPDLPTNRWRISASRTGDYYARLPATAGCQSVSSKTVTYRRSD